jgi:hypothetical protein
MSAIRLPAAHGRPDLVREMAVRSPQPNVIVEYVDLISKKLAQNKVQYQRGLPMPEFLDLYGPTGAGIAFGSISQRSTREEPETTP